MVLEKLGESLKATLNKVTSALFVDEKLVNELVKELQRALLQSDVNVKMVFELSKNIKDKVLKSETPGALTKKEWLIKVVYDELVKFLGESEAKIDVDKAKKPFKIMLVGLFGNGKTTTAGKLGKYFMKRGHKVALISTDTWRPAAFEQLKQLGAKINADVFGDPEIKDPVEIYKKFEENINKYDIVIIDTAGRDSLNDELIEELKKINNAVSADERLLVMAADVGQAALDQAKTFHETTDVTGVIMTRLDGTAKGGGALAACSATGAKVKFVGVGEKIDDLEYFDPEGFVGRLLGMGDIKALMEKAKEAITEEEAQDLGKKFLKGEFNLLDMYEQMQAVKKMGPLSKVLEMIPGMGQMKIPKELVNVQEGKLKKWKFAMDSCTKEELEDPDIMTQERISRIAQGSGTSNSEFRELLKQYKQGKKMMKMLKGSGGGDMKKMQKMMSKMQKGGAGMKF
ncbi:signal recognition particle protein Srp54 [Nanoarchaeota archaeon]